jgi:riboflavin synthase
MFTGIVEAMGRLVRLEKVGNLYELEVEVGREIARDSNEGDSIALDGCCLTVTGCTETALRFQAIPETRQRTALSDRKVGDSINLEQSLRADARLGGHFVLGHIDGTGRVRNVRREGDDVRVEITCSPEIARFVVSKGSVALDGVSLTVVESERDWFSVALIPHTLEVTNLGQREVGDRINIEVDVVGRYVVRYLDEMGITQKPAS